MGPGGIPVAAPDGTLAPVTGAKHYTINIQEFTDSIGGGGTTLLWGYNPTVALGGGPQAQKHLGGIIVADKGTPIQITFQNNLPITNIIPVDTTILGSVQTQNRTAVHLHGGHIPWYSDGGPFDWFDPNGVTGDSFLNNRILNPAALPGQGEYYYTMDQSARLVWYHEHAFGLTRINAYAGVASAMIIRDAFEADLVAAPNGAKLYGNLPQYIETSLLAQPVAQPVVELPLVFQDKVFVDQATIGVTDPTWVTVARPDVQSTGSLWYAHVYDPKLYKLASRGRNTGALPNPSCVPEFFGDTMLVNGTVYPNAPVEARPYRLRLLNACNARFLNLQLFIGGRHPGRHHHDQQGGAQKPAVRVAERVGAGRPDTSAGSTGGESAYSR